MRELQVSASDFRVHLKDYLNQVAEGGAPVIVVRHGFKMGAMVDLHEYSAFLEWRRRQAGEVTAPDVEPDGLSDEELERAYVETAQSTDDWTMRWRSRAYVVFKARTGHAPKGDPPS
jgi:prevent-host-death family protein